MFEISHSGNTSPPAHCGVCPQPWKLCRKGTALFPGASGTLGALHRTELKSLPVAILRIAFQGLPCRAVHPEGGHRPVPTLIHQWTFVGVGSWRGCADKGTNLERLRCKCADRAGGQRRRILDKPSFAIELNISDCVASALRLELLSLQNSGCWIIFEVPFSFSCTHHLRFSNSCPFINCLLSLQSFFGWGLTFLEF